ncbi:biliverdin-producing heme oxygenase [Dankookia rubra]|uniref:Biliverdin-producing heme oxygenase n=1 Tax=Dankookia rubra TaxID=1442381 RepID=A0A4V3A9C7_9PROT|nr:biliverdin-producing heme oxygenase [Dankookia rubra]TDH58715.1 biliverdin-producing heme oxygenase [Dankookia rubra]
MSRLPGGAVDAAAPGGATVRAALRAATDPIHARLHDLPGFRALAEGRLDRAAYADLLCRLLGFHRAVEAALDAAPSLAPWGIDVAARRRAWLIEADLQSLGAAPCPVASIAPLPPLGSAARALGCLYVTEGSTLGGRHLARALDGLLPPGRTGRRFLLGHGDAHAAMWRACCQALEACGADPARRAAMLTAAAATFAAFEAWFTPARGGVALPPAAG